MPIMKNTVFDIPRQAFPASVILDVDSSRDTADKHRNAYCEKVVPGKAEDLVSAQETA